MEALKQECSIHLYSSFSLFKLEDLMRSLLLNLVYYSKKNLGKILTSMGILFLVIGLLFLSPLPSTVSILAFFLGITFTLIGILVYTESIMHNILKTEKIGSILVVVSIILFAGSFAFFLFRDIGQVVIVVPFGLKIKSENGPHIFEFRIVEFKYPLLWLSKWLFIAGLISLIVGFILKNR
jgi:hypothetical protein